MRSKLVDVTFTLDTAAYANGDVLADTQEVRNALLRNAGIGEMAWLTLIDLDDQTAGDLDVVFLTENVSLGTENDPVSISDIDATKIISIFSVLSSRWVDVGGAKVATLAPRLLIRAGPGTTSIYMGLITRSARTHTANGIVARLGIEQG